MFLLFSISDKMDKVVVRRCNHCHHSELACACFAPCFCNRQDGLCAECLKYEIEMFYETEFTIPGVLSHSWEEDPGLPTLPDVC